MAIAHSEHGSRYASSASSWTPSQMMVVAVALGVLAMAYGACKQRPAPNEDTPVRAAGRTPGMPEARTVAVQPDDARVVLRPSDMIHEEGHAWIVVLPPDLADEADTLETLDRSLLRLLEDDKLLGPPHSRHDSIRKNGRGAYSHWVNKIFFSTSDNTDPTRNGRVYELAVDGDVAPDRE
jgi:hypothetical protein